MKIPELIKQLQLKAARVARHGGDPNETDVVLWDGDDTAPVVSVDYDKFDEDTPWVVIVEKAGDP